MGIPTNYTELQAEIANWLKRDDLTDDITSFIAYGEADINKIAKISDQEVEAAVNTTAGQEYTALPSGFLAHISLTYNDNLYDNPVKVELSKLDDCKDYTVESTPQFFAISNNRYYWDCLPNDVYNLTSRHWKKWDIAGDDTNWLLTNYPDVYLFTALKYGMRFVRHPKVADYAIYAKDALDALEYQSAKLKRANLRMDDALLVKQNKDFNIYKGY